MAYLEKYTPFSGRFASKQQPVYLCLFVSPQDVKSESAMNSEGYGQSLMKVVVNRRIRGREDLPSLAVIYEKFRVIFGYLRKSVYLRKSRETFVPSNLPRS